MGRALLAIGLLLAAAACGGGQTQTATPSSEPTSSPPASNSTRPATEAECQQILQREQAACESISGTHSAQIDGWCTDVRGRAEAGWVDNDCTKHVRYVDVVCFMSDTGIASLMDCEGSVEKTAPAAD